MDIPMSVFLGSQSNFGKCLSALGEFAQVGESSAKGRYIEGPVAERMLLRIERCLKKFGHILLNAFGCLSSINHEKE